MQCKLNNCLAFKNFFFSVGNPLIIENDILVEETFCRRKLRLRGLNTGLQDQLAQPLFKTMIYWSRFKIQVYIDIVSSSSLQAMIIGADSRFKFTLIQLAHPLFKPLYTGAGAGSRFKYSQLILSSSYDILDQVQDPGIHIVSSSSLQAMIIGSRFKIQVF